MAISPIFGAAKSLLPSAPPPRKLNYSVADLLVKTVGTIAMTTVEYVSFRTAKYKYDRFGRITLECVTVTRIPGENQRLHKMQWFARDPHYSGKLSKCKSIMFSCDCVTGDTRVLTDNGLQSIYSLLDRSSNPAINFPINYIVNDKSYKGSVPFYKGKKPVWEITLANGSKIKATKNHKIRVLDSISRPRTYLAKKRMNLCGSENRNAYIWHLYLADGTELTVYDMKAWTKANGHNYGRCVSTLTNGKSYKNILRASKERPKREKLAPRKQEFIAVGKPVYKWVKVKKLNINDRVALNTSKKVKTVKRDIHYWKSYFMGVFHGDGTFNPLSIECHSHPKIIELIKKAGVNLYENKQKGRYHIPIEGKEILQSIIQKGRHYIPDDIDLYGFVSGLIDSDGCIGPLGQASIYGSVELKTVADKLKSLGIKGVKFNLNRNKGTITNIGTATRDMYVINISVGGMRQILKNICAVKCEHLRIISDINIHENVSKIKSILYKGKQDVYDIHVPKIHRFVAESMIVHNCAMFKFVFEYAYWSKGLSEIRYSNGGYPTVTNPSRRIALCKHGLRSGLILTSKKL